MLTEHLVFQTLARSGSYRPQINQPTLQRSVVLVCVQFIDKCKTLKVGGLKLTHPRSHSLVYSFIAHLVPKGILGS